jgi:hypothetical protein
VGKKKGSSRWKSDIGSMKHEAGSRKQEAGSKKQLERI